MQTNGAFFFCSSFFASSVFQPEGEGAQADSFVISLSACASRKVCVFVVILGNKLVVNQIQQLERIYLARARARALAVSIYLFPISTFLSAYFVCILPVIRGEGDYNPDPCNSTHTHTHTHIHYILIPRASRADSYKP
jgi:hypothetical protein